MTKTYVTRFPSLIRRLKTAQDAGGIVMYDGELMKIEALEEIGDQVVADLTPLRLIEVAAA